jgi:hypothetical protein
MVSPLQLGKLHEVPPNLNNLIIHVCRQEITQLQTILVMRS